jgi:hypothetical protein
MKNIFKNIIKFTAVLGIIFSIASCGDEHDFNRYDLPVEANSAKLKFVHTAVGPAGANFSINYSVNDKKISALSVLAGLPLGFTFGNTYPLPLNYAVIPSGAQPLKVVIPARLATPTLPAFPETPVFTGNITTVPGKDYTSFLVGTSPNYEVYTINDDFSFVNPSAVDSYIRFINLVTNTPTAGYELVITRNNPATPTLPASTTILKTYTAIGYKGGSPIFEPLPTIPVNESTAYVVQLRVTGTTTIVSSVAGFIPRPGRTYTFFTRGFVGGLPNATTNLPGLTFYTNR